MHVFASEVERILIILYYYLRTTPEVFIPKVDTNATMSLYHKRSVHGGVCDSDSKYSVRCFRGA